MKGLQVGLLGKPRLELDGQPLTRLMAAKHQALVFYLAAQERPVRRNRLASLLWSQLDPAAARGNLRVALSRLRRQLPDLLAIDGDEVGFVPRAEIRVDLRELERVAADPAVVPRETATAVAGSWRGALLEGFDPGDADEFDQWLVASRQRAARHAVALRAWLAQVCEAEGRLAEAIEHLRGWLDIDEADEQAHMALMRLLATDGRRTAALAQYEVCRATLMDRLGARPSAACYSLYCRIHADAPPTVAARSRVAPTLDGASSTGGSAGGSAGGSPGGSAGESTRGAIDDPTDRPGGTDLPIEPSRLVGREDEIALLAERLLDPHCHWLTIVGPGGIGKTRVAAAAASRLADRFPGGLTWFSGREIARHGDVVRARPQAEDIARAVASRRQQDPTAPALLVLDNLESLADARELVTMLLGQLRAVRVLATSRVRLGGQREWLLELPGLDLAREAADDPCSSPAVRLFVDCLRRLEPQFEARLHGAAIERICRRVGGLPLALELAAHGAHVAGVDAIANRVAHGASLADPDRAEDDPHRSLDVVLEDSWRALPPEARTAALRVAALPDELDAGLAAAVQVPFDAIATLRRHSWLGSSGNDRLAMHPLQRAFLRRHPDADRLAPEVASGVTTRLRAALPSVPPFGCLEPEQAEATAAAGHGALLDGPVVALAVHHALAAWPDDALCGLVDDVVAWLEARGRLLEASALLERPCRTERLPPWRRIGWRLRQGELVNQHGAGVAAARIWRGAIEQLGFGDFEAGSLREGWPASARRGIALSAWPPANPERQAFSQLACRCLALYGQQLSFTARPGPLLAGGVLLGILATRTLSRQATSLPLASASYGLLLVGRAGLSRIFDRAARRRHPERIRDDRFRLHAVECLAARAMADGRWHGLAAQLDAIAADFRRLAIPRHEMETRSLAAKLAFYQGSPQEALRRFEEVTVVSLPLGTGIGRFWGPIGEIEANLAIGTVDLESLRRQLDEARQVMTEFENYDVAYTLRWFGLRARVAWRQDDAAALREAVLTGASACQRIAFAGFWAHEGFAGIGEGLVRLRRREREQGGAVQALDAACSAFRQPLAAHSRRFTPARTLWHYLAGLEAAEAGRIDQAARSLRTAVQHAERQGMRLELARACSLIGALEGDPAWSERASRLWRETGAATEAPALRGAALQPATVAPS